MGVDRSEVLSMRVFPSRNALATRLFMEEVLKHCDGTPTFAVDSAPWLAGVLKELGLRYNVESLRR
jgi:transposase-like protein